MTKILIVIHLGFEGWVVTILPFIFISQEKKKRREKWLNSFDLISWQCRRELFQHSHDLPDDGLQKSEGQQGAFQDRSQHFIPNNQITASLCQAWETWGCLPSWQNPRFLWEPVCTKPTPAGAWWGQKPSSHHQQHGLSQAPTTGQSDSLAWKPQTGSAGLLHLCVWPTLSFRQSQLTLWPSEWRKPGCRERRIKQLCHEAQRQKRCWSPSQLYNAWRCTSGPGPELQVTSLSE